MSQQKSFAVIGLGRFGFNIAKGLGEQGMSVLAIDNSEEKIRDINEYVDQAIECNSSDLKALKEAGVGNVDVAVISIGEDIEASIMTVMSVKELGVESIIAKAITPMHGQILTKIGANRVVYPEKEVAMKLVKNLCDHMHYETIDLSNTMKIVKLTIPERFVGKTIKDAGFEEDYNVKLIAYKNQGTWQTTVDPLTPTHKNDVLVILGNVLEIEKLSRTL